MAPREPNVQQRIGIDVGGTNTDAVLMQGREFVGWVTLGTRSRAEALAQAGALAVEPTITAGAHPDTVQVVDIEEIPLTYLPSNALRMRVKAVGDVDLTA